MFRTYEQWLQIVNEKGALWKHDGNPKRPHALLTKGGHSNGFFHGQILLYDLPRLGYELCCDFYERLILDQIETIRGIHDGGNSVSVISPAMGAVPLATLLGVVMNVGSCITMPVGEGKDKTFILEKRFKVKGKILIPAEDVITSGDSVIKTIDVAQREGATIAPIILVICNRSGLTEIGGCKIVSFFDIPMMNWTPEECPLCKLGSAAIRPKDKLDGVDNWELLSKAYP